MATRVISVHMTRHVRRTKTDTQPNTLFWKQHQRRVFYFFSPRFSYLILR